MTRRTRHFTRLGLTAAVALGLTLGSVPALAVPEQPSVASEQEQASQQGLTWTLHRVSEPSLDQIDAYTRIEASISAAVARWSESSDTSKHLNVYYVPGVPTAEANYNGDVRFGANRAYMNESVALHEISHVLGIGQTQAFFDRCATDDWPSATALLQTWDGPEARVSCGGGHIWPYGLNYSSEFSNLSATRHIQLIDAMLDDGL